MTHEIVIETVAARPLAAVRRRVRIGEVSTSWRQPLDQVWAFLRRHQGLRTDGHNIFLYHHPADREDPMDVNFGVEITGPFEGEGEVVFAETPAGTVASTVHVGPYDRLREAHDAVHAWRAAQGRSFAGVSWEIYGDPSDDPTSFEVRVIYLLA
jgi:effector-binding domain-containing protein